MTDVFGLIETPLYAKLTSCPGTALWGTQIYEGQAPAKTVPPYVVYAHINGGDVNDNSQRNIDATWQITCVALKSSEARQGAAYIDDALHMTPLTLTGGWSNYWLAAGLLIRMTENVEGKQYYRRGARYNIRVSL